MGLNKPSENIKKAQDNVVDDCDDCKRGPCVGRLKPGEEGFTYRETLFLCDGHFYLNGCSIIVRENCLLPVKINNRNGVFEVSTPTLEMKVVSRIGPKDIPVGRKK